METWTQLDGIIYYFSLKLSLKHDLSCLIKIHLISSLTYFDPMNPFVIFIKDFLLRLVYLSCKKIWGGAVYFNLPTSFSKSALAKSKSLMRSRSMTVISSVAELSWSVISLSICNSNLSNSFSSLSCRITKSSARKNYIIFDSLC